MVDQAFRIQLASAVAQPLRIKARSLAEGRHSGLHRASTKGAGIEFAGHRAYTPGDDLRHLDRHAQLRHNRLLIREFHAETERSIHVVCDASASMVYADPDSRNQRKLDLALLLAASLSYLAHQAKDDVGLTLISGIHAETVTVRGGASLEPVLCLLEAQQSGASAASPWPAESSQSTQAGIEKVEENWLNTLDFLAGTIRRGSIIFVLSDLLDLNASLCRAVVRLATRSRTINVGQILTKNEISFPFEGSLVFRDPESGHAVQADAGKAKERYREELDRLTEPLGKELGQLGGSLVRLTADEAPERALARLTGNWAQGESSPWA
jgi:uncharacterized protein (DUF58 family)